MKKLGAWIRSKDGLSEPGYALFHYDEDERQKTFVGGLGSLYVKVTVGYIAVTKGIQMFQRSGNSLLSVESGVTEEEHTKLTLIGNDGVVQPMFQVWEGKGETPDKTVKLDRES